MNSVMALQSMMRNHHGPNAAMLEERQVLLRKGNLREELNAPGQCVCGIEKADPLYNT